MAGSGIVVNGQLVRGMDHLAGEVALLPLNLSDAYLTLANTPEGTLELVTKNIMSIIAIVAPEAIVVYSDLIFIEVDVQGVETIQVFVIVCMIQRMKKILQFLKEKGLNLRICNLKTDNLWI